MKSSVFTHCNFIKALFNGQIGNSVKIFLGYGFNTTIYLSIYLVFSSFIKGMILSKNYICICRVMLFFTLYILKMPLFSNKSPSNSKEYG